MSETNSIFTENFPCVECRAGILRRRHVTYFTWLGGELVSVPHFPAWVCDVCGKREYDSRAITWLNMILDPNAGKPTPKRRHPRSLRRPQTGMSRPVQDS
jgi:YgiT-type zinc finger domain-containing protein